ncbi:CorA family divalent cation transporter [Limosilactobacillus fermentum]
MRAGPNAGDHRVYGTRNRVGLHLDLPAGQRFFAPGIQERRFGYRISVDQQSDLDDVIIEAQQGLEMAQMTSDVTGRVSDAYSKVLDSNLNQTMKFLTVYSIILSIPPIVSGCGKRQVPPLCQQRLCLANHHHHYPDHGRHFGFG